MEIYYNGKLIRNKVFGEAIDEINAKGPEWFDVLSFNEKDGSITMKPSQKMRNEITKMENSLRNTRAIRLKDLMG